MDQFNGKAFELQSCQDGIDDLGLLIQADAAVAKAVICGNICAARVTGEVEFVLNCGLCMHTMYGEAGDHAFEEGTRAGLPGLAVQANHVAHHAAGVWYIGQNNESLWVGNEAKLADWSHALD